MFSIYKKIQVLSLDVVGGACLMSFMLAQLLETTLFWSHYVTLGASVWLIYTIDHLMDAQVIKMPAITMRHRFHQEYYRPLLGIWVVVFMMTSIITFLYLPVATIKMGLLGTSLVVVHLVMLRLFKNKLFVLFKKELRIALGYTFGVAIGPISMSENYSGFVWLVLTFIFGLALLNLIQFSLFDRNVDVKQNQKSIATELSALRLSRLIIILNSALTIFWSILLVLGSIPFSIIAVLGISLLVLTLISLFQPFFEKHDRYRVLGDMVFCFPVFLLF